MSEIVVNEPVAAFDFGGNGKTNFAHPYRYFDGDQSCQIVRVLQNFAIAFIPKI